MLSFGFRGRSLLNLLGSAALALVLCLAASTANPAPADLQSRVRNVLPGPSIHAVVQGPHGYLWIASSVGLIRYDGRRFEFSSQTEGFTGAFTALALDAKQHVWAAGDPPNQLLEITEAGTRRIPVPGLQMPRALLVNGDVIWAADDGGLLRIDTTQAPAKRPQRFAANVELPRMRALALTADGKLWVGGELGLWYLDEGRLNQVWANKEVYTLHTDAAGNVLIGSTEKSLFKVNSGSIDPVPVPEYRQNEFVRFLSHRSAGGQWAATETSLGYWHNNQYQEVISGRDMAAAGASNLAEDHEGNLWIGALFGGLLQVRPPQPFVTIDQREPFDLAFGMYPSQQGGVWILTGAGRLKRTVDHVTVEQHDVPNDLNVWSWRSFVEVNKGELWMGSLAHRLMHFIDGRWERMEKAARVEAHGVRNLLFTSKGRLYLAYDDVGFAFLDGNQPWQFRSDIVNPCQGPIVTMNELPDGRIAMGTTNDGVCVFDGQRMERLLTLPPGTELTTLTVDKDQLWVASTNAGVFLWENGKLYNAGKAQGLPSEHVGQVYPDHAGFIWLSSRYGIFRIPEGVLLDTLHGKRPRAFALTFGAEDGLPSITCLWGWNATGLLDTRGQLWIPTTNGIAVFRDPGHAIQTPKATPIVEEVVVNGEALPVAANATSARPRERGNLLFRYTVPTFVHQHRLRFRYRLRGFDDAWTTTAGDRATAGFTNVPPGLFTFEVVAWFDGQDPQQAHPGASVTVELLKPFYSWWLFRFAVAFLLAALTLGLWAIKQRQRRAQTRAVANERTRIARELHDTLDQTFVAVGLQLQAATAKLSDPSRAEVHIERANELIDRGLAEARGSIWALREEHPDLAPLPSRVATTLGEMLRGSSVSLKVKSHGPLPDLDPTTRDELIKILREAATNAIRHGRAQKLAVLVASTPASLQVSLQDDGEGFDPEQTRPGTHGLRGMIERARAVSATVHWQSSKHPASRGTTVTVTLPIRTAHLASHR